MFAFLAPAALRLMFGRALGGAASGVKAAGHWLGSLDLMHVCLLVALLFGGWQTVGRWAQHRHTAKVETQLAGCTKARATDAATYAKGQADAAAKNLAHNATVEQHYQRNNDNEGHSYLDDLARLRAQRVRPATPSAQGAANGAASPASTPSIPRIDEAGLCVPATSDVCEAGAEIELRLMHLQNLFDLQAAVDPNKEPAK